MHQPLSYVHSGAKIDKTVVIEPFVTIEKDVEIGEGTWIGPNVTIMEGTRIGKNCRVFPGAVIGAVQMVQIQMKITHMLLTVME